MPGGNQASPVFRTPGLGPVGMMNRSVPFRRPDQFVISGVTRDSAGAPLGLCLVQVFRTPDDRIVAELYSDATGNYVVGVSTELGATYYAVAYKAGSPDVAGTTVNTLTGIYA